MSAYRTTLVILASVMVMLVVWVGVAQATVTIMSISRGGAISESSSGLVTLRESGGLAVECRLVLRGSFVTGTVGVERNFGEITSATWESCRGGTIRSTLNFPWTMKLAGTLLYLETLRVCNIARNAAEPNAGPNSCGVLVLLHDTSIEVTIMGFLTCLYGGVGADLGILFSRNLTTGRVGIFPSRLLLTTTLRESSGLCGSTATVSGELEPPTPEQTITFF